jgi:hypothetical protein
MEHNFSHTWEIYTLSWKAESKEEKIALFESCLAPHNIYTDPMTVTTGWDELLDYMLEFHQQISGGHFVTQYFLAHHNQSIARWVMRDGSGHTLGEGISYAKYNESGLLLSETGFFESP